MDSKPSSSSIYPKTINHIAVSVPILDLEIFEYIEAKAERRTANFEHWKSGFIHICVTEPDIKGLSKKISESGGRQRSKIWEAVPDKGIRIAFCEVPFGNIIEIYDHNYEQTIISLP